MQEQTQQQLLSELAKKYLEDNEFEPNRFGNFIYCNNNHCANLVEILIDFTQSITTNRSSQEPKIK